MGIAMLAFMHLYLKYTYVVAEYVQSQMLSLFDDPCSQPLFIQGLMGLKGLFDAKEVMIHVIGKKAEGDLARPFKAGPGMFGGAFIVLFVMSQAICLRVESLVEAPGPATDAASIKAAEESAKKTQ